MTKDEEIQLLTDMVYCAIGHYTDGWWQAPDLDEEWDNLRREAEGGSYDGS